jgi:uncharacterized phage-associated protein
MIMESIFEVAKYFLSLGRMNHRKLQKLCYYAQAWSLALTGTRLMNARFEAWAHGPVSPELWHRYKDWGGLAISSYEGIPSFNSDQTVSFLKKIYQLYGDYSGDQLEQLTHNEMPWINARGDYPPGAICTNVIDEDDMTYFYRKLLH